MIDSDPYILRAFTPISSSPIAGERDIFGFSIFIYIKIFPVMTTWSKLSSWNKFSSVGRKKRAEETAIWLEKSDTVRDKYPVKTCHISFTCNFCPNR